MTLRLLKLTLAVLVIIALLLLAYMATLYPTVTKKFEGQRWAVPARVYSRSLELYAGAPVSQEQLVAELGRLGYRRVDNPQRTGEWTSNAERLLIRSRSFQFWDGIEPEYFLDLRFSGDRIVMLKQRPDEVDLAIARLEPLEIGSIYPAHSEDRVILAREDIPQMLVTTLLAVEDRRFYKHHGVDPTGLLRAAVQTLVLGNRQGGSTVTQQLIKNMYLTPRRDLRRKINEALMAVILDAKYDKDDILTAYVNEIYLGQDGSRGIHGFGLASLFYFDAPLKELDLPRVALLVGMLKGPSQYNPRRNPDAALTRRNVVLGVLLNAGLISESQFQAARAAPLGVTDIRGGGDSGLYPAFMDLVRRQLQRDYEPEDLDSEGLRIFTTFDPWVQQQVEAATDKRLAELEQQRGLPAGRLESATVVVTPQDAEVLAVAGGRRSAYAGFNRALDASRPIGSLVKPAIYLAAFQQPQRYSLVSWIDDKTISMRLPNGDLWEPSNYDREAHGWTMLEMALAKSYNLSAVHLGLDVGLENVISNLQALGVRQQLQPYPSLLLGAVDMTPLEVAQMYQTIASGGFRSPLRAIRDVLDQHGQPLQRYPLTVTRVNQPGPTYLLSHAMQAVVREGTAAYANTLLSPELNLAGKTGTTNDLRDSWFAGFSGDYVAVVWVGRDDNTPAGLTGSSGALRIWTDMMRPLKPRPLELIAPDTVEFVAVDAATGLLANASCATVWNKPFLRGFAPTELAPCAGGSINLYDLFEGRKPASMESFDDGSGDTWNNWNAVPPDDDDAGLGGFLRRLFN